MSFFVINFGLFDTSNGPDLIQLSLFYFYVFLHFFFIIFYTIFGILMFLLFLKFYFYLYKIF